MRGTRRGFAEGDKTDRMPGLQMESDRRAFRRHESASELTRRVCYWPSVALYESSIALYQ